MNSIRNLKLGPRLGLAFGSLILFLAVVTAVGLFGVSQAQGGLKTVYEDRTVALGQLAQVDHLMMRNRIVVMEIMRDPAPATLEQGNSELRANIDKVSKTWSTYAATALTEEEKKLVNAFVPARTAYVKEGLLAARDAIAAGKLEEAAQMYAAKIQPLGATAGDLLSKLVQLQVDVAADEFKKAQQTSQNVRIACVLVGLAAAAVAVFLAVVITRSIVKPVADAARLANAVAGGDLTHQITPQGRDEISDLLAAMKGMNEGLAGIVSQVRDSSESIATGSAEIATGNADLSQRTEEQASNLEETAASMEEMTATVRQNADIAHTATQLAGSASAAAGRGGEVVGQVVSTMEEISSSSHKISEIIGVIDGIAFQTNILALNAAVEAARAGEQGRGFAVVASEVRSLAQRSAEAAKDIKGLIGQSVEKVEVGSRLVREAGTSMTDIVAQVKRVADLISEIGAATTEQTQGIGQVGEAVNQLDRMTQQNAALVEESAAAAESLKGQALRLADIVRGFQLAGTNDRTMQTGARAAPSRSHASPPASQAMNSPRVKPPATKPAPAPRINKTAMASASSPAPASTSTQTAQSRAPVDDGNWETF
ncbi:methyl-accepting chemotaxis protein [Roseateles koreensis]|uniref:Methyl-accepting chemotaxis protein n=1 Tax=Roseateles koreensis TaxID=2987526 RepID=A0ABT5KQK3_9BURK|nr:methyl-accepting chemotaxis protein [Roseateles koreensis]MDC8784146.1 methyl-accepting chemotaxis protein [Roseateles koreensis]